MVLLVGLNCVWLVVDCCNCGFLDFGDFLDLVLWWVYVWALLLA